MCTFKVCFGIKVPVTGVSLGTPTLAGGLTTLFSFLQLGALFHIIMHTISLPFGKGAST